MAAPRHHAQTVQPSRAGAPHSLQLSVGAFASLLARKAKRLPRSGVQLQTGFPAPARLRDAPAGLGQEALTILDALVSTRLLRSEDM